MDDKESPPAFLNSIVAAAGVALVLMALSSPTRSGGMDGRTVGQ